MRITIRLLTGLFLIMWLTDPLYEEEPMQVHPLVIMIVGTIFFASLYSGRELPKLPSEEKFKVDYKPKPTIEQQEYLLAKLKAYRAEHKEVANEKEKEHWRYIIKNGMIQEQYKVGSNTKSVYGIEFGDSYQTKLEKIQKYIDNIPVKKAQISYYKIEGETQEEQYIRIALDERFGLKAKNGIREGDSIREIQDKIKQWYYFLCK